MAFFPQHHPRSLSYSSQPSHVDWGMVLADFVTALGDVYDGSIPLILSVPAAEDVTELSEGAGRRSACAIVASGRFTRSDVQRMFEEIAQLPHENPKNQSWTPDTRLPRDHRAKALLPLNASPASSVHGRCYPPQTFVLQKDGIEDAPRATRTAGQTEYPLAQQEFRCVDLAGDSCLEMPQGGCDLALEDEKRSSDPRDQGAAMTSEVEVLHSAPDTTPSPRERFPLGCPISNCKQVFKNKHDQSRHVLTTQIHQKFRDHDPQWPTMRDELDMNLAKHPLFYCCVCDPDALNKRRFDLMKKHAARQKHIRLVADSDDGSQEEGWWCVAVN